MTKDLPATTTAAAPLRGKTGPQPAGYYWAYDGLGSNVSQAASHLVTHPASLLRLRCPG
jgi:hypothetical protein